MNPVEFLNHFLLWLGRASIQASLLIVLILAVQALLRDRLAPRWRHALWLLLLARLVLPWAPPSSLSVYNLVEEIWPRRMDNANGWLVAAPGSQESAPSITRAMHTPTAPVNPSGIPQPDQPTLSAASAPGQAFMFEPSQSRPHLSLMFWAAAAWLAGVAAVLTVVLAQSLALGAAIRKRRPVTDQALLDLLEDCKEQMNVRAWLMVAETPQVKSPALFGFLRPRLLLPEGALRELGPERLRHVLLHELAHLKRHDIALNWLISLLQALHWFNPLIWYAFFRLRADRELVCDAMVLARIGPDEPSEYGRTIIQLLENIARPSPLPSLAGILESKVQMRRRIIMIAKFKKASRGWPMPATILLLMLGGVALTDAEQKKRSGG